MSRVSAFGALALLLVFGCGGDDTPPPIGRDAGPRDAGSADSGDPSAVDGSSPQDASPDHDGSTPLDDGGRPDSEGSTDGSVAPGGDCFDDAGVYDLCRCTVETCDPSADTCAEGLRCLPDGCGRSTCQPGGLGCVTASDCPTGSTCRSVRGYDGAPTDVCDRPGPGCADSRDCAPGQSCSAAGVCELRRVPCASDADCGFGFFCNVRDNYSLPYCQRIARRCETIFGACPPFFSCVDVDRDGVFECRAGGAGCDTNDDCVGDICGYDPTMEDLVCGNHGPCRFAADCGPGFTCADTWGDGVTECVPTAGTCTRTADCASPAICTTLAAGGALGCHDGT
ncbi:MAG: hypothetical protein KF901_06295 [Myxococcales bacterium]|nr:hypothetical protein [Myxococcales bacterium]